MIRSTWLPSVLNALPSIRVVLTLVGRASVRVGLTISWKPRRRVWPGSGALDSSLGGYRPLPSAALAPVGMSSCATIGP